jgi:adenosine deaminase CECR1
MSTEACAIVDQIRFEEQQTLWTREYEDSLSQGGDVFPGMMFSLAKDRMEQSKLWQIVRRMPKGTLLHCHLEAMVDLDWVLEEAFATEGVCITSSGHLSTEAARLKTPFSFTYAKTTTAEGPSIWTDSYTAAAVIPIAAAADSFPSTGRKGFLDFVKSRSTITSEETIKHHEGPNEIWRKFISCFPILGSLIYYEPIFRKFIRRMCKQLLEDGVFYVDMRAAFYTPYRSLKSEDWDPDFFNLFDHMDDEIEKFKKSEEGKDFWGARMIWTTVRSFDNRGVIEGRLSISLCLIHSSFPCNPSCHSPKILLTPQRHESMHRNES